MQLCSLILFAVLAWATPVNAQDRAYNNSLRAKFWTNLHPSGSDIYCASKYAVVDGTPNKGLGKVVFSIEHATPQSWIAAAHSCKTKTKCEETKHADYNWQVSDMHNLWPALQSANGRRSNKKFANIEGGEKPIPRCDLEIDEANDLAEPRAIARGNLARSVLYMNYKYGIAMDTHMIDVLKQWHEDDPPNREEIKRNGEIAELQSDGRNPFIDKPDSVRKTKFNLER